MVISIKILGGDSLKWVGLALWLASGVQGRADAGRVVAWGDNYFGQASVPAGLTGIVAVAAGQYHELALRSDGALFTWGTQNFQPSTIPNGLSNVMAVAAGYDHSVAIKADGTAIGWGRLTIPWGVPVTITTNAVAVAAGYSHAEVLRRDGTVIHWGAFLGPGPIQLPGSPVARDVIAIAAGTYHSLAVKRDGTVIGWGRNDYGQTSPPPGLSNVVAVAAGNYHSTALKSDGTVVGWGANWAFSDIANQAIPPAGLSNVVAITAGAYHNLALKSDGSVVAWGWGAYGLTNIPDSLGGVIGFSAALSYNLVITTKPFIAGQPNDITAYLGATAQFSVSAIGNEPLTYQWQFFGTNFFGTNISGATNATLILNNVQPAQAGAYSVIVANGSGNVVSRQAVLTVLSPPSVTTLAAGGANRTAVFKGTVNPNGTATTAWFEWGTSTAYGNTTPPNAVGDGDADVFVTASQSGLTPGVAYHYRLVATNSAGRSNGQDAIFQSPHIVLVGDNPMTNECHQPFTDPGARMTPPAIVAGEYFSMALRSDGTVAAWGSAPTPPPDLTNVAAIAAGYIHCLALKTDGTVVGWGDNSFGETSTPLGLSNVVAVSSGWGFSLALQSDGKVIGWGLGATNPVAYDGLNFAQAKVPDGLGNVTAISAGFDSSLALKSDGTVVSWGRPEPWFGWLWPYFDGAVPPAGLSNVIAIATGGDFGLALKSDGTVVGWGYNGESQVSVPDGLSNVVSVAAGFYHSLALKEDGTVIGWGDDFYGEATPPAGLSNVVAISAGAYHSLALKADGSVAGWGLGFYGETDASGANLAVCVPAVGAVDTNTPGTYILTYSATNSLGIVGTATRTVVVVDTTPPLLVCPTNMVVEFATETGAPVFFTPQASDLCSTLVAVTCDPASGSTFPIGTTPVFCTANDASGNSATSGFQVTVLGARGVKSNVLSELIALRNLVRRPRDRANLAEAIWHLNKSLEASLWMDETHLTRKDGVKVFNQERAAVQAIARLMNNSDAIPDSVLRGLANRVAKADRLLAVVAIVDAANAGLDPERVADLQRLVTKGDADAASENYDEAIEHYKDAWHHASRLSIRLSGRVTDGNMRLEFSGFPAEGYVIEASTNLADWTVVKTGTVGPDGAVQFDDVPDAKCKARFYRIKFVP